VRRTQPFSEKDDGGDIVETSFVADGLIALKNYFTGSDTKSTQIREKADQLWKEIDWNWYRQTPPAHWRHLSIGVRVKSERMSIVQVSGKVVPMSLRQGVLDVFSLDNPADLGPITVRRFPKPVHFPA